MALNTQLSNLIVNAQGDSLAAQCNAGSVKLYTGAQPATADTAISTQTILASLTFAATAAPATSGGVVTFNPLTAGTAVATGTAAWFRVFKADGTTALFDGSIGTSASNMVLGTTSIVSGASVTSSSFVHTVAKSAAGF